MLSDHGAVFAFHEGVVVGMSGPGFGESDEEFVEHLGDIVVDELRAVVRMKTPKDKGKHAQEILENGFEIGLTDVFHRENGFELEFLIHGVDVIEPLFPVPISGMNSVHAKKPGHSIGLGRAALPDAVSHSACLVDMPALTLIRGAFPEVVQMRNRDLGQSLEAGISEAVESPLAEDLCGRS
jgi:hypothetical protein